MLKHILNGFGWVSLYSISQMLTNLALTMILARLLTPAEVGSFAFAMVIVSFLQIFTQLGINAAVVQIKETSNLFFSTAFTLVLVASIFVTLLCIAGMTYWLVAHQSTKTPDIEIISALRILVISLPFFAIADLFQAMFNRDLAFRIPASTSFASYVLGYASICLILASLGLGTYALIFAFVSQHVLRASLLFIRLENRPRLKFNCHEARRILRFGLGFSIAKIGNVSALQADNLIVASYLGNSALGLYSRSYQIIMSPIGLLSMIVDRVLFPAMSRRQDNTVILRSAFLMLSGTTFALFLPLSLVLFEFRHELVLILLGSSWSAASGPFGMLGIGLSFRAGYRLSDIVARARGLVYQRAFVQWIYAGCVILSGIVGTHWGLTGVALGISSAIAVNWLLMTALTTKSLDITWSAVLASFKPALFTSALTYLTTSGLSFVFDRTPSSFLSTTSSTTLIVSAVLVVTLTAQSAKVALGDWKNIYERAKHAD